MRLSDVTWTPALRVAAACAALALLADFGLIARALTSHDDVPAVPLNIAGAAPIVRRAPDAVGLLQAARARQPFEPLGGPVQTLASAGMIVPQAMPMAPPQPRLVGTVVRDAESFVVMAMPDGSIKVVRIGERAGDLRLRAVTASGAMFDDIHGGRVTLRPPTPGSEPQP